MMMKILAILMCFSFFSFKTVGQEIPQTIYDFKVEGLNGETIDFKEFKGKKILIVNTASKCDLTPQYEGLEKLYRTHKDRLVIVGFPANNFLFQEPGSNEEIAAFCEKNYGVTFPMAAKISVKGKQGAHLHLVDEKEVQSLRGQLGKVEFSKVFTR